MKSDDDAQRVRKAKTHLAEKYQSKEWCTGIGLARGQTGFELRLNVDPAWQSKVGDLPSQFEGFPVQIVYIAHYHPRDGE